MRTRAAAVGLVAGMGVVVAASPVRGENWTFSSSASAMETYTSNVNYSSQSTADSDFVTTVSGALNISGNGRRVQLNGSIGASVLLYAGQSRE